MGFINEDSFLLHSDSARRLYRDFAAPSPIIDYHCHLDPRLIAEDYRFRSISELMLGGDHYKWRLMRACGIDEKLITGCAGDREKFSAYASVLPRCIGNPIYHWTHLELLRYFGIDECLTERTADEIYDECSGRLALPGYSARELIARSGVELLCTTDDPSDELLWHKKIAEDGFSVRVLPTFRPDRLLNIEKPGFLPYIRAAGISDYRGLLGWLVSRIDFFHRHGCRLSDHGLESIPCAEGDAARVLDAVLCGEKISVDDAAVYRTALLRFLAREYDRRDWCMQLHFGALRDNNGTMYRLLGADTGFDAIADDGFARPLARLLDGMNSEGSLPRTIIYSLNPNDTKIIAALAGCFQSRKPDADAPGKAVADPDKNAPDSQTAGVGLRAGMRRSALPRIQPGAAWWFNDTADGISEQLRTFASFGVLGGFVGMLTDSRSFVSYARHEYFRRILCDILGGWVDAGEYPADYALLGDIVGAICYRNAKDYFGF